MGEALGLGEPSRSTSHINQIQPRPAVVLTFFRGGPRHPAVFPPGFNDFAMVIMKGVGTFWSKALLFV